MYYNTTVNLAKNCLDQGGEEGGMGRDLTLGLSPFTEREALGENLALKPISGHREVKGPEI